MTNTVTVIDYGLNNIQSVIQALQFIGVKTKVASTPSEIDDAKHIIIPGVGAFPEGMKKLHKLDKVAYVRFASVYRSFQDLSEFQDELNRLKKSKSEN